MRYFIYISYVGKGYSGWQLQQNGSSVQQVIQETLSKVLAKPSAILGSSRTDKGVHARQQVAHFDTTQPLELPHFCYKLNRMLPEDIAITAIHPVVEGAHARFDASYRIYEYTITTHKDPFDYPTAIWLHRLPSLTLLNQAAALFCRQADFEFFSKVSNAIKNFVCNVEEARWQFTDHKMVFRIKANRFLRGMVRAIVAAILQVSSGKMSLDTLEKKILLKPKPRPLLKLVPPQGLTLVEIGYPIHLFL